jgi:formylglycine-generating enzyme required for sulfatase activity
MGEANGIRWTSIPGGEVALEAGGYLAEPACVAVEPFAIARCPVTNAQYAPFVASGGYAHRAWWSDDGWALRGRYGWAEPRYWDNPDWNRPDHPVVGVSWYEAMAFCRWLGAGRGERVTLPSEGQWQRAAQGDDGREFPWGDEPPDETRCNWNRYVDETTPVMRYPGGASPYGVMDMSGNVWEWCRTGWTGGQEAGGRREPRLVRGGSWSSDSPISLRAANRSPKDPNARLLPAERNVVTVGFRCVRT